MTVTIDENVLGLALLILVGAYVVLSYLWWGPILCRRYAKKQPEYMKSFTETEAIWLWLISPLAVFWHVAFTSIIKPIVLYIVFGSTK